MGELSNISGKTFLITGGASGLGAGYAEAFLKAGAKKVALLDVADVIGNATAERLNKSYPGSTVFVKCDVSREESITEAFDKVVMDFGTLDVIINNAGIMNDSPGVWRTACEVNMQGVVSLTLKGLKYMRRDEGGEGGTIINIASMLAIEKCPFLPIYSGCKAGILYFSSVMSVHPFFDITGVRIMTMCFGATDTPLLQDLSERSYDKKAGKQLAEDIRDNPKHACQKPESAVRGVIDMFKHGACGSVWAAKKDKPAVNITSIINNAYNTMEKEITELTN